jgi:hypothetical protein
MAKVPVYRFQLYDPVARAWRRAEGYATAAYIAARNGATLFNTKRVVDAAELSAEGLLATRGVLRT